MQLTTKNLNFDNDNLSGLFQRRPKSPRFPVKSRIRCSRFSPFASVVIGIHPSERRPPRRPLNWMTHPHQTSFPSTTAIQQQQQLLRQRETTDSLFSFSPLYENSTLPGRRNLQSSRSLLRIDRPPATR